MQPKMLPPHAAPARRRIHAPTGAAPAAFAILLAAFLAALLAYTPASAQSVPDWAQNLTGCYAIADERVVNNVPDGADTLVKLDTSNGQPTVIGLTGTLDAEAMAFGPNLTLYTVENGFLGTVNSSTGAFTAAASRLDATGPLRPVLSPNPPIDVDGLVYSPERGLFFASVRRMLNSAPDLLFAIDPATAQIKRDYFGAGVDYIVVQPLGIDGQVLTDIDDLALDPVDGTLYAAMNSGGYGGEFVRIDPDAQTATPLVQFRYAQDDPDPLRAGQIIDDIEGLSFFNSGILYGSTGDAAPLRDRNRLYQINAGDGTGEIVGEFPPGLGDYEALACATAQAFVALEVYTNGPGQPPAEADTAPGPEITAGSTVTWTYRIVNTGGVALTGFNLTDSVRGALSCPPAGAVLDPGDSLTCTATGTAALGQYATTGTLSAHAVGDPALTVNSADDSHYFGIPVPGEGPGLDLALLVNGVDADSPSGSSVPRVQVGSTVTFTYIITNTGDTNLGNLVLTDSRLGSVGPAAGCLAAGTVLAPDQVATCTRTAVAQSGLYAATATVTGVVPGSSPQQQVSRVDLGHYIGQEEPALLPTFTYLPLISDN